MFVDAEMRLPKVGTSSIFLGAQNQVRNHKFWPIKEPPNYRTEIRPRCQISGLQQHTWEAFHITILAPAIHEFDCKQVSNLNTHDQEQATQANLNQAEMSAG